MAGSIELKDTLKLTKFLKMRRYWLLPSTLRARR